VIVYFEQFIENCKKTAHISGLLISSVRVLHQFRQKIGWAVFWATFSQQFTYGCQFTFQHLFGTCVSKKVVQDGCSIYVLLLLHHIVWDLGMVVVYYASNSLEF
jgi:hypothetical protein